MDRETLDIDVLFVGAGPASLAGAYHLANLIRVHNETASSKIEVSIAVLEKGREIGSHALSGAVVDPRAFRELYPKTGRARLSRAGSTTSNSLLLTKRARTPCPSRRPWTTGQLRRSLGKLVKWIGAKAEAAGWTSSPSYPPRPLWSRTAAWSASAPKTAVSRNTGTRRQLRAGGGHPQQVVVLGEGPRGTLVSSSTPNSVSGRGATRRSTPSDRRSGTSPRPCRNRLGDPHPRLAARPAPFGGGFFYGMDNTHSSLDSSWARPTRTRCSTRTWSSSA